MTLWTPANLLIPPKVILDPSVANWSGSNWGSTPNLGTGGGSIVSSNGTPVKSTQLNSLDTVSLNGTAALGLASQNWTVGTDYFVFSVFKVASASLALVSHGWGTPTSGMIIYPRRPDSNLPQWNTDDFAGFSSGSDLIGGITTGSDIFVSAAYDIMSWTSGDTNFLRKNGTIQTLNTNIARTVPAQFGTSIYFGQAGPADQPMVGAIAYMAICEGAPTLAEYQKLEGWAAWKYGLVAQLDGSHPYKFAAPLVAIDPVTLVDHYVQGKTVQNGSGSAATMSLTLTNSVGVGNTLVVTLGAVGLVATDGVIFTDDKANVYTAAFATPTNNASGNYGVAVAYLQNITNIPQTISAFVNNMRTFLTLVVDEWSGLGVIDTARAINSQTSVGIGVDAVTSGLVNPTINGDLIYGFGVSINSTGLNNGTSFFNLQSVTSTFYTESLIQATAAPIAVTFTANIIGNTITYLLAFKPFVAPPVAVVSGATITVTTDSVDIVNRVKRLIPNRWFSFIAPYRDAILGGLADIAAWCRMWIQYARSQSRLSTAYGIWLDIFAYDFLGKYLTRNGANDDAFRIIIRATILQERVTRSGMIGAVTALTGKPPVIFEPWNTFDTGAYSSPRNTGAPQYGSSGYAVGQGGYGNMLLNDQVFMKITRGSGSGVPGVEGYGNNIGGYGAGAIEYVGTSSELWGITDAMIYQMVNNTKPTGTTMWVQFQTTAPILTTDAGVILTDDSGFPLIGR